MKKILVYGVGGALLFSGTVLGMLAAQGRLNHAGTQGIPVLSSFFPAPPADEPAAEGDPHRDKAGRTPASKDNPRGEGATEHSRSDGLGKEKPLPYRQGASVLKPEAAPTEGHGGGHSAEAKDAAHAEPSAEHGAAKDSGHAADGHAETHQPGDDKSKSTTASRDKFDPTAEWKAKVDSVLGQGQFRPGRLWNFPQMEGGISVDELNEIVRRARQERTDIDRERGALQQERRDLEARERDIADRQESVLGKLREVEQLRATLQAEIDEFHNTVLLIRQDEVSGLQSVGKTLAGVEPKSAATVIKKWWETDEGQARALKIWSIMDPEAANAILAELDVEMIRQVLEKRLKVVREQAKTKGKK